MSFVEPNVIRLKSQSYSKINQAREYSKKGNSGYLIQLNYTCHQCPIKFKYFSQTFVIRMKFPVKKKLAYSNSTNIKDFKKLFYYF